METNMVKWAQHVRHILNCLPEDKYTVLTILYFHLIVDKYGKLSGPEC